MGKYLWLIPLGFIVGSYATLIGAGGGFILVPVLLLLYPEERPEIITGISLVVVFFNSLSGSVAYARMKRIDYKSGLLFAATTLPGAVLGALSTAYIPRRLFDATFGLSMIAASAFLILHPEKVQRIRGKAKGGLLRNLVEANGTVHTFSYNPFIGVALSLVVGYVSSLLGIGGGIIKVPTFVHLLNFPVHIATATSVFISAVMALMGATVHILTGTFHYVIHQTITLAFGVLFGAQFGAWLSKYVKGGWIIRGLAIALGFVGIRILAAAFK